MNGMEEQHHNRIMLFHIKVFLYPSTPSHLELLKHQINQWNYFYCVPLTLSPSILSHIPYACIHIFNKSIALSSLSVLQFFVCVYLTMWQKLWEKKDLFYNTLHLTIPQISPPIPPLPPLLTKPNGQCCGHRGVSYKTKKIFYKKVCHIKTEYL